VTGDGVADLRMIGGNDYLLFVGPIVGDMTDGIPYSGALLDTNLDGQLDEHMFTLAPHTIDMTLAVRFGPLTRGSVGPDVVIHPSCPSSSSDWSFSPPATSPDFVGDGLARLSFPAATYADTCRGWWITLPLAPGTYDPASDPDAISFDYAFGVFPDQTGDGIAEITLYDPEETVDIYAGPLVVEDGAVTPGEWVATAPALAMNPIPFDLNHDDIGEFLVWHLEPGSTSLVYGGSDGLARADQAASWVGLARRAFLEDGVVSMWVARGDRAVVIDLGVGVPVP
jgi:hypothetical protein